MEMHRKVILERNLLDKIKGIAKIHGGARSVRNVSEKQKIAEKAVSLILPDTMIFLDSGSTAAMTAQLFPDQSNLIYTTGLNCATKLSKLSNPMVMIPGGVLNRYSQSVYGISVVRELERVNFSQAFLGVASYSLSAGFRCESNDEAIIKQTVMKQSEQTIVLMDSSKVGAESTSGICGLDQVDVVVSDGNLPEEFLEECRRFRVKVL